MLSPLLLLVLLALPFTQGLSPPWSTVASRGSAAKSPSNDLNVAIDISSVVSTVAVAGATGRTGRIVVQKLLDGGVSKVRAIVRDSNMAAKILPTSSDNLEIVQCDLLQPNQIKDAMKGADAVIWCATGFSSADNVDPLEKFKRMVGMILTPKRSIDSIGLPALAEALAVNSLKSNGDGSAAFPRMVMCSSAGVTRPTWSAAKKQQLEGAADIPIVRLNPFGILDVKRESEERLRQTCVDNSVPYCIVRPAGLNDNWPAGSRPIVSQGDVAVGRINREDVATILVGALTTPEAVDKTFEVVAVAGYPPAPTLRTALSRLRRDDDGEIPEEVVAATYHTMQQLLPGEQQNSAGLAMGQTYEELDRGKTGRLGERGREQIEAVAPKPTS